MVGINPFAKVAEKANEETAMEEHSLFAALTEITQPYQRAIVNMLTKGWRFITSDDRAWQSLTIRQRTRSRRDNCNRERKFTKHGILMGYIVPTRKVRRYTARFDKGKTRVVPWGRIA